MSLADDYEDWIQKVGNNDQDQGTQESEEWVENTFGDQDEFTKLLFTMMRYAVATGMAQDNLGVSLFTRIQLACIYAGLRYGIDYEAKKRLPQDVH